MYCEILPVMNHEFLYSQKGLLTYIGVIMCHHPHDPHFTSKVLQYARNKRVHILYEVMTDLCSFHTQLKRLWNKSLKKTSGLNGIWTHDLFDTGAVQYCFTCPLVEHTLVTMNNVAVVLNRSNEPATIERISLRFNLLAQTDYIWFQRQCESLIDVTFLSK